MKVTYLFVQVNEQLVRKFQILDCEQHYIPVAVVDIGDEAVDAVDRVERDGRLLLKRRQSAVQIIFLQILHDQANHAANSDVNTRCHIYTNMYNKITGLYLLFYK